MSGFLNGLLTLDGVTFTTSSGDNNDAPVNGSLMSVSVTNNNDAITGVALGQSIGAVIWLVNISSTNNLVVKNNNSGSVAANRILTANGLDLTVPPSWTAELNYDITNSVWHVVQLGQATPATSQATPSDPTGTTNGTGLMMGLAGSITPQMSGKVMIVVSGNISATGIGGGSGAKTQIRYGTGTAPTNGAALTGTAVGNMAQIVNAALALIVPGNGNFTCNAVVTGLTVGTAYWIDQSLARITSGTATITGVSISVIEV